MYPRYVVCESLTRLKKLGSFECKRCTQKHSKTSPEVNASTCEIDNLKKMAADDVIMRSKRKRWYDNQMTTMKIPEDLVVFPGCAQEEWMT